MTERLSEAQRKRVQAALPRVQRLARKMARTMPHVSTDELVSAGSEGLVQAAMRYDPACGVPFAPFSHYRIRGAMIDAARRAAPSVRRRSRAVRALEATQSLLERAQAKQPAAATADTRTLQERVAAAANLVAEATTAVMLSRVAPADPDSVAADTDDTAEACLLDAELSATLRSEIEALPEAPRQLYQAIYVEGVSMHTFARRSGLSVSTVSRHHAKLLAHVRERLAARLGP